MLCERGAPLSVDQKGQSVLDSGGIGMVIYNSEFDGPDLPGLVHYLPASAVSYSSGMKVLKHATTAR